MFGSALALIAATPAVGGAPTLVSSTINTAGTTVTDVYSQSVTNGAGGSGGTTITMSGGAVTSTYSSGSGSTTLVYTLSRTINNGETGTRAYTQPGNGIEATTGGADVATYSGAAVTNNSTVGAPLSFIGQSHGGPGANDTTIASASQSVTAGRLIVVGVSSMEAGFSGSTVTAVTDTAGNTYTACTAIQDSGVYSQIWYAYNCLGNAANVVTATWSVACRYKTIVQGQVSGANTTAATLVAQATGTGSTAVTSGNLTTATDTILIAMACSVNDRPWTPDTGFTEDYDIFDDLGYASGQMQHKLQTGAGTYTVTSTPTSGTSCVIAAAAFK